MLKFQRKLPLSHNHKLFFLYLNASYMELYFYHNYNHSWEDLSKLIHGHVKGYFRTSLGFA